MGLTRLISASLTLSIPRRTQKHYIFMAGKRWTESEKRELKESYYDTSWDKLKSLIPDRSRKAIKRKAQRMDLRRKRLNENDDIWSTHEIPGWFEGELISDGCVTSDGRYTHTTTYRDYAKFLAGKFSDLDIGVTVSDNSYTDSRTENTYQRWIVRTKSLFDNVREKWYPCGSKCVPSHFSVDDKCFLHWVMGDGTVNESGTNFRLCAEGFGRVSLGKAKLSLSRFGLDVSISSNDTLLIHRNTSNKKKVKDWLDRNVSDFHPCYNYKSQRLYSWTR